MLEICYSGGYIADIGEYSNWHAPINSLLAKGYLKQLDKFNNIITDAGRAAFEAYDDQLYRDIIEENNNVVRARQKLRNEPESDDNEHD